MSCLKYLFFDIVTDDPFSQIALAHAYSQDGITAWIQDEAPFLLRENFTWTNNQIRSPTALDGDDGILLWFAGDDGVDFLGIGQGLCRFQEAK